MSVEVKGEECGGKEEECGGEEEECGGEGRGEVWRAIVLGAFSSKAQKLFIKKKKKSNSGLTC